MIRRFRTRYRLVVAIGSREHRNERRDPFGGSERKAMMDALLREAGIEGLRVVTLADGPSEAWAVENLVRTCRPDVVLLSTERRGALETALAGAGVRVARFRRTGAVSSTRVRDSIAAGTGEWRRLTGRSVAALIERYDGPRRIRTAYGRTVSNASSARRRPRASRGERPTTRRRGRRARHSPARP